MQFNSKIFMSILRWATFGSMLVAIYFIFIYAPTETTMGDVQRIFYFHLSSALVSFLTFFIVFIASILYLWKKNFKYDLIAYSSAEIGMVFSSIVLITGSIWAKSIWNTWWTWDPRLTTMLILWFSYAAYIILRKSVFSDEDKMARFCSVFGIVAFVNVPLVFMSIRWWRTIHPIVFKAGKTAVNSSMIVTLVISLVAFTILCIHLLFERYSLEMLKREIMQIKINM